MKKVVTLEQIGTALLQAKKNNEILFFAMLMSMTGMRTSEIIALRWNDVSFENASFQIYGTSQIRSIALSDLLKQELIKLKETVDHAVSDFVLRTPAGS